MRNNAIGELGPEAKNGKLTVSIVRGQDVSCGVDRLHVLVGTGRVAIVKRRGQVGVAVGAGEVNGHIEADLAAALQVIQKGGDLDSIKLVELHLSRIVIVLLVGFLGVYQRKLLFGQKFLSSGLTGGRQKGGEKKAHSNEQKNKTSKTYRNETSKEPMKSWSP